MASSRRARPLLEVRGLRATAAGQEILTGLDLVVNAGEVHAIMGPNGSGKSTLAMVLAGNPAFTVTGGSVHYLGEDILALAPELRARKGIFLAFQTPMELPGVRNSEFLRASLNSIRVHRGLEEMSFREFGKLLKEKMKIVKMQPGFNSRSVNEGFSGGEKKKNEILQMALLEPRLAILDETDSGLDIDALKLAANGVNNLRNPKSATVIVTHYQRILDYITPDRVHVIMDGRIVRSGDSALAKELEAKGYEWIRDGSSDTPKAVAAGA